MPATPTIMQIDNQPSHARASNQIGLNMSENLHSQC